MSTRDYEDLDDMKADMQLKLNQWEHYNSWTHTVSLWNSIVFTENSVVFTDIDTDLSPRWRCPDLHSFYDH